MKNTLLSIAALILVAACGKSTTYTIDGHLAANDFEGKTIYLYDLNDQAIDSTIIVQGTFTFTGQAEIPSVVRLISISQAGKAKSTIILEPGTIYVDLFSDSISGTPLNDGYYAFNHDPSMQQYQDQLTAIEAAYFSASSDAGKESLSAAHDSLDGLFLDTQNKLAEQILSEHPNDPLGALMLYRIALRPDMTLAELESRIQSASPVVADFAPTKKIVSRMRSIEATAVGQHYVDFVGVDYATGEKCKLSEMIEGKLALVDFWSSWCSPCREEIVNNIIDIHAKYAKKGLYVIGIDVWDEPDRHRAAVEELGIRYPQLIVDHQKATDLYGITGIPHIMLIGSDGIILARDLRGSDIEKAVKENI